MTTVPGALAVDMGARTITGIAVPHGPAALNTHRLYRFLPGFARHGGRVPLLLDHVQSQRLGWVFEFTDTPDGLYVVASVKPGRPGDRALAEAHAGRLGFSPGLDPAQVRITRDPDEPGARLIAEAPLLEISLTACPAFGLR